MFKITTLDWAIHNIVEVAQFIILLSLSIILVFPLAHPITTFKGILEVTDFKTLKEFEDGSL